MRGGNFDRSAQDVGNIVFLEHVNVRVPDQVIATRFYIAGLGLTRDPYLMVSTENMWANAGQSQFPADGGPKFCPATWKAGGARSGALRERLEEVSIKLRTQSLANDDNHVPSPALGQYLPLLRPRPGSRRHPGLARVECRYVSARLRHRAVYQPVLRPGGHRQRVRHRGPHPHVHSARAVLPRTAGPLSFAATNRLLANSPGRMPPQGRGLVSEESSASIRFQEIVDLDSGAPLATLEHEVRCLTHPMYFRPLINRNPGQRQPTYARGRDAFYPGLS